MLKHTLLAALAAASFLSHAQTPAPSSPAKKELVARVLKNQQPGIEAMAKALAEQPAALLLDVAANAVERAPADKREALTRVIHAVFKKYGDEVVPLVRDRAVKLAPSTIGVFLEEKFTEEELKQIVAMMESPVFAKFQQQSGVMQKVLADKLIQETRGTVEAKIQALDDTVAKRLGAVVKPVNQGAGAKPPTRPASR